MMIRKILVLFTSLLLLCFGCHKGQNLDSSPTEIWASIEDCQGTKTTLSEPDAQGIHYPFWREKDEIAIYADATGPANRFTLSSGAGTERASFTGSLPASCTTAAAVYPYSVTTVRGLSDKVLTLSLPAEQQYVQGSFADGAFPMVANGPITNMTFKNLCALLQLSVTGEEVVQSIVLTVIDKNKHLYGRATVRVDYEEEPNLEMVGNGSNSLTLKCGGVALNKETPTLFYFVIPCGYYSGGFTLTITTNTREVVRSTSTDFQIGRSRMLSIPSFDCGDDGGDLLAGGNEGIGYEFE